MNRHERYKRARGNRIVVSETKIGPTVIRRRFAPFAAVAGLIADAIASEQSKTGTTATPTTTAVSAPRNGTTRKPNGHTKVLARTMPSLRDTFFLYDGREPSHRNPSTRPNRYSKFSEGADEGRGEPEKKSWKRYRATQWRGDNRWSCRREALAFAVAAW